MMLQKACGGGPTIRAQLLSDILPGVHDQWVGQVGPPYTIGLFLSLAVLIV